MRERREGSKVATFRRRSNNWECQVFLNGKLRSKTFKTKSEARQWVKEQNALTVVTPVRVSDTNKPDFTMAQVLQKYLDEVVPTLTDPLKTGYKVRGLMKISWVNTPFSQLTSKTLNQWRDYRYKTCSTKTVWTNFNSFKTVLNHAIADDWDVPIKLFRSIKLKKVIEREVPRLEDYQLEALLEAATAQPRANYLPHIITFAIETCMRKGEMLKLEWSMVDLHRKVINCPARITKTKQRRTIPISHKCEAALLALQELLLDGDAVFRLNPRFKTAEGQKYVWPVTVDGLRKVWSTCRVNSGMEHLHWHDLRHEGISRLFELGLTVPEAKSVSGHSTFEELDRYATATASIVVSKLRGAA